MNKVFVVTAGSYSDYHIVGVFSTKKLAEEYRYKLGADDVEEYELDGFAKSLYSKGYTRYLVWFRGDTTTVVDRDITFHNDHLGAKYIFTHRNRSSGDLDVELFAKDEKHAVKIASEIRSQIIASGVVEQFFKDHPEAIIYEHYLDYTDDELKPEVE